MVAPAACTIDEQLVADAYAAGLSTGIIGLSLGCTQRRVQQILVALRNDGGLQRATARRTTGLRPCTGIQKRTSGAGVTQHPPHRKASQVAMHPPRHSTRQRVDSLAVPLACTRARARARARASAALARVPVRGPAPGSVTSQRQHTITQITVAATRTHTSSTMRRARKG